MIINDDVIEYLGNNAEHDIPESKSGSNVPEVDLQGRSVFPSFIDGHMHLSQFGASLLKFDLDKCENLEDIRATIREAARSSPNLKRIFCRGWRQSTTGGRALASMIDDIDPRPIIIDASDLHSAWCNSAALKEMNLHNVPDPPGGTIHRDEKGNPTGLISESAAMLLVWPYLMRNASRQERLEYIRAAVKKYNAAGYTGVVEMAMEEDIWELLEWLRENEQLRLRIAAHWIILPSANDADNLAQVQKAIELNKKYNSVNSPDFRIVGIKAICDGVVDSCTAALSKPYSGSTSTGEPLWTASALKKIVRKADAAHLQVALHAIGDAMINLAINTLETEGTKGSRHRIEHLELTRPDDAKRLGELGITASVQPYHLDPAGLRAWPELLGAERCSWAFPYRRFSDHGAELAIGTDSPTAPHLPFPNVYVATTRRSAKEQELPDKFNEHFRLDLHNALNAATWGAAYSCFADERVGSLEVGKKADFIVVEGFEKQPSDTSLLKAQVVETWMDGKQIYRRV